MAAQPRFYAKKGSYFAEGIMKFTACFAVGAWFRPTQEAYRKSFPVKNDYMYILNVRSAFVITSSSANFPSVFIRGFKVDL